MKNIVAATILFLALATLGFYLIVIKAPRDNRLALDITSRTTNTFMAYVINNNQVTFKRIDAELVRVINSEGKSFDLKLNEQFKIDFFAYWQAEQITNVELRPPTGCRYTVIETFLKQVDNAKDLNEIISGFKCVDKSDPVLQPLIPNEN